MNLTKALTKEDKEVAFFANTLTQVLTSRIGLTEEEKNTVTIVRNALNKFLAKKVGDSNGNDNSD